MFNNYKEAFLRLAKIIPGIADQYKTSSVRLYLDALYNYVIYGVTPNEYIGWQFYAKSAMEKNTFYSARRSYKYERKLNDPAFFDTFWKKEQFNKTFAKFISRKWLFVPESTDEEIAAFIKQHPKVIVKPTSLSAGRGIHIYNNDCIEELRSGGGYY